jgi:hypothetical protein
MKYFLLILLQRGGADSDMYANAAESNSFLGTIGSLIVGGIIWWIVISTSNSNKKK